MTYISTFSGGKDSSVMIDLLLKNNYPVDYIIFYDTGLEFPEMYKYIDFFDSYLQRKYHKKIIRLKTEKDFFRDYIFSKIKKGKRKGQIQGFLGNTGFCHWRTYAKQDVEKKFTSQFKEYKIYLGITKDELHRKKKTNKFIYPLIDYFDMSERQCLEYLKHNNLYNNLYDDFTRTGCYVCPYMSFSNIFSLYKNYPFIWKKLKDIELLLKDTTAVNKHCFYISVFELEKKFKFYSQSLFDFSCKTPSLEERP